MIKLKGKCRVEQVKLIAGEIGVLVLFIALFLGHHACHNGL